jgi:hypothetical protein
VSEELRNNEKHEDQDLVNRSQQAGQLQGIDQKPILEAVPTIELGQAEKIIKGENGSFIILGRDRPSVLKSGYGGKGATQAARIDLVAGLASSYRHKDGSRTPPNKNTIVSPSFASDAARVYISQKSDIDSYMGLAAGPRDQSIGRSTVALKADTIRMHARGDVKIVTGRARFQGFGNGGETLSTGGDNEVVGTISLIAGNYTDDDTGTSFNMLDPFRKSNGERRKLQPIPKGDNIASLLEEMIDKIAQLSSIVNQNNSNITYLNNSMMTHVHLAGPIPTTPSLTHPIVYPLISAGDLQNRTEKAALSKDLELMKINYLNPDFGSDFINSKFVFTT